MNSLHAGVPGSRRESGQPQLPDFSVDMLAFAENAGANSGLLEAFWKAYETRINICVCVCVCVSLCVARSVAYHLIKRSFIGGK